MKISLAILSMISVIGFGSVSASSLDQIKSPAKHTTTFNAKSQLQVAVTKSKQNCTVRGEACS